VEIPSEARSRVRFGEFHLDLKTGELSNNGNKLYLQEKPFQILSLLLDRPGQVVTRAELTDKLWPPGTFVDFEQSVNKAVNRLREALHDSSENPRFIETLPRRGYRFIGDVKIDPGKTATSASVASLPLPQPTTAMVKRTRRLLSGKLVLFLVSFAGITFIAWLLTSPSHPAVVLVRPLTHDTQAKGTYATLATDGARIYFEEVVAGKERVTQVSAAGGDTAEISLPFKGTIYDISPDGSQLLFGAETPGDIQLWIQPLPAGPPRRVGDLHGVDAGWAPDGDHFVYADGPGVFWARSDGMEARKIATTLGTPAWPRVSPDGRRVRFTAPRSDHGPQALWEVGSDGGGLHPLLPRWNQSADQCCGRWTDDGRYYVFQSGQGGTSNIWLLPGKRIWWQSLLSEPFQLTHGPLEFFLPQPSRDGKQLFAIGEQLRSELVRYDSSSGAFVPYLGGISATGVEISRDRQWATYVAYPEGTLWRCRIDGSERLQLTNGQLTVMNPHWSPDGRQIAFTAWQPGVQFAVYLVPAAGGPTQKILAEETSNPSWSPDSRSLAFNRFISGKHPGDPSSLQIEVLDLASQRTTILTGSEGMYLGGWSPDGRHMFAKTLDHHRALLFDSHTQRWSTVAEADMLTNLRWSRDGGFVYFEATTADRGAAWMRMRIADNKIEYVMDFRNLRRPLVQLSAAWTGLAEDDSPLTQRDIGTQEIYALEWRVP